MTEYIIVSDERPEEVAKQVSKRLNEGWKIAGGIAMAYKHMHEEHAHGRLVYAQAMEKDNA